MLSVRLISLALLSALPLLQLHGGAEAAPCPTALAEPVPYRWSNVAIGGGGFVSGLLFHPAEPGLLYARTDVGGAYRWDAKAQHWLALMDFIGSDEVNLTGIESLAIDPSDPKRIYLAAGTYTHPRAGNGALFASCDQGRSFQRYAFPFKLGANEAGRGNGERLAVDPKQGNILFFGSRTAGLWRSEDYGRTWAAVPEFPAIATSEAARANNPWKQALGINFVLFETDSATADSGSLDAPTQTLYAGVSTRETWLYQSLDAGKTWTAVPGQPLGLRPTRPSRASDGTLFFTFGDEPGPNTMSDGAVWKYEPKTARWTNITPEDPSSTKPSFGYGAVSVDPSDPQRLIVSSFCRYAPNHDVIYRSLDGGKTWRNLFQNSRFEHPHNPWAAHHTPHWMADLRINPFNPGDALFVTGYGVYRTQGLLENDQHPERTLVWTFDNAGLEETVPLGLLSPPEGAPLLSALGDIDGFRHEKLDTSGETFASPPRFANSESIAFAGAKPSVIVRCGTIRGRTTEVRAALSTDGGLSWAALASEPASSNGAGTICVSADGETIVWTTQKTPPAGATGMALWRGTPNEAQRTADLGKTWEACKNLPVGLQVIADQVDPLRFFAYDPSTGSAYESRDGARSFQRRAQNLPSVETQAGGFGGGSREGGRFHAVLGKSGELWLETRSEGLHHSLDGGATWTHLTSVTAAYSLGLGKPAPASTAPTLFLAGEIRGKKGLFRSLDYGLHWQSIDDPLHRFGWINHVTGDPRVFGRVFFGTGGRGIIVGEPAPASDSTAKD